MTLEDIKGFTNNNNTTLPPPQGGETTVFEKHTSAMGNRRVLFPLLLLGIMDTSVADALPRGDFSYNSTSETGQVVPYVARPAGDTSLASVTQPVDPATNDRVAYMNRIDQLRSFAEEDGIEFSTVSEHDFLDFACTEPRTKRASLVLLDNGNLRAVWRMGEQELGVQFYGDGAVQYLISQKGDDGRITHTAQRGIFDDFLDATEAVGLGHLLYE